MLRNLMPDAIALFNFRGNIYPNQPWVNSSDCDVASIALEPGVLYPWILQPPDMPADYADNVMHLQRVQSGLKIHHGTSQLELLVRIYSNQTTALELQSALAALAPNIVHLRVLDSLPQCLRNLPPLTALRTLEFCILNNYKQVALLQTAVSTLPRLEALHIFSNTIHSTENLGSFLQVLSACSNITSLQVVTDTHSASIPSDWLYNIKHLSLGHLVCFDRPPPQLQQLYLQRLQHDFYIHVRMLAQLQHMMLVPSLEIEACSPAALLHLPSTLVSLTLHEPFTQADILDKGEVANQGKADLHQVFGRLPALKVLGIGNYLSNFAVNLFQDMYLPSVHTFGFRVHPLGTHGLADQAEHTWMDNPDGLILYRDGITSGNMVLTGPSNLSIFQQALPNVQLLQIWFFSHTDYQRAMLHSSFLRQLSRLRGLTCICSNTLLTLEEGHLPPKCYAIFKGPAVH